ncbi:unnamed protein product, partial [Mesorhabditis spiculigera]
MVAANWSGAAAIIFITLSLYLEEVETNEYTIYKEVFTGHSSQFRPTDTSNQATAVLLTPLYLILLSIDMLEEHITFSSDFAVSWIDPTISWSGQPSAIKVPELKVWIPDVSVFTALVRIL